MSDIYISIYMDIYKYIWIFIWLYLSVTFFRVCTVIVVFIKLAITKGHSTSNEKLTRLKFLYILFLFLVRSFFFLMKMIIPGYVFRLKIKFTSFFVSSSSSLLYSHAAFLIVKANKQFSLASC